jgi:hypothetical protein
MQTDIKAGRLDHKMTSRRYNVRCRSILHFEVGDPHPFHNLNPAELQRFFPLPFISDQAVPSSLPKESLNRESTKTKLVPDSTCSPDWREDSRDGVDTVTFIDGVSELLSLEDVSMSRWQVSALWHQIAGCKLAYPRCPPPDRMNNISY